MKNFTHLVGLAALFLSQSILASTIISTNYWGSGLIGTGVILDDEFGLDDLQRVDDEQDHYWTVIVDEVSVTVVAKYAGFKQDFGFIDDENNFTSLLHVPDDHMVSWLITDDEFDDDYVHAWEDLEELDDHDYDDWDVHVSGVSPVPVPGALWLLGSGILGLVVVARRYS